MEPINTLGSAAGAQPGNQAADPAGSGDQAAFEQARIDAALNEGIENAGVAIGGSIMFQAFAAVGDNSDNGLG
ncbi:MAG: hypothetical protein ACR2Q4_10690 [Geminicoccaceae bacterium]